MGFGEHIYLWSLVVFFFPYSIYFFGRIKGIDSPVSLWKIVFNFPFSFRLLIFFFFFQLQLGLDISDQTEYILC